MFSKEDASRNEENPQENTNTEARSQQSCFATLLKSHPWTDPPPEIPSTSAEHSPPGEHLWRTDSACQKNILFFYYEKFLFTVVKINSLAIKVDNNNNDNNNNNKKKSNKYPVIVSRSPRNALRFSHWALLP